MRRSCGGCYGKRGDDVVVFIVFVKPERSRRNASLRRLGALGTGPVRRFRSERKSAVRRYSALRLSAFGRRSEYDDV